MIMKRKLPSQQKKFEEELLQKQPQQNTHAEPQNTPTEAAPQQPTAPTPPAAAPYSNANVATPPTELTEPIEPTVGQQQAHQQI